MKNRLGLILSGIGLVLALVVTADPMIEHKFIRILVICVVFYLIGFGLEIFYKKFIVKIISENEGDGAPAQAKMGDAEMNSLINDPSSSEASKGGRFDFKVGGEGDIEMASLAEDTTKVSTKATDSTPSKLEEMADKVAGREQKKTPFDNKFEIGEDFILINDKKIPNDPKMMADAIKTKLSE